MNKASLCAVFALLTASAVGQTYHMTAPLVPAQQDITTMTATVNAWKYFPGNPVCASMTLTRGRLDNSISCMGANNGPPYKFDRTSKTWIAQSAMETAPVQLVVINWGNSNIAANIYSLQPTSYCTSILGSGWFDLFHWNTTNNTWVQPHAGSCMTMASADYKGTLSVVGWDGNRTSQCPNGCTALFQSTDGGASWALWSDLWKFINMTDDQEGCAITNANSIWQVWTSGSPSSFPALPSGTAAGCTVAQNPFVMMAWNTAGQAYVFIAGASTWQAVTGINLQHAEGVTGYYIFGEDSAGKPYHWNVNAPGMVATYGGQWSQSQGCPTPGTPCNNNTTHTLHHALYFNTCHGINGCAESTSTQLWSANFSLPHSDYNPQCDPYFGGGVDEPECHVTESAYGHCNASGATLDPTGTKNYEIDDTIDVLGFQYNVSSDGPERHQTVMYQGWYDGHVHNKVKDECAISDPVPACPVNTDIPDSIYNRVDWIGKLDDEARAYTTWHNLQTDLVLGIPYPVVSHGWYMAQRLPGGSLVLTGCYGGWIGEGDFLWGDIYNAPACK